MIKELKPCPFCGSSKVLIWTGKNDAGIPADFGKTFYYVSCSACGAETVDKFDFEERKAIERWNKRNTINPDEWNNALRTLVQAISKISKLVKNEI